MTAIDSTGPFYHGTRVDLKIGDLLAPGYVSNYGERKRGGWIYFTATLEAAIWGAELAKGSGRQHIYVVEPTGEIVDDPNLTDKKFPGNPTKSYRSRDSLRIVGEVSQWQPHRPEQLQAMLDSIERLRQQGAQIID
ncbi:MAG: NAD(+)--rifampin ADP-ribosyltransferase [Devosia sp.]